MSNRSWREYYEQKDWSIERDPSGPSDVVEHHFPLQWSWAKERAPSDMKATTDLINVPMWAIISMGW